MPNVITIAPRLLNWYDKNGRKLAWRVSPAESLNGIKADPYHIWLSEIMLQQTTVRAVEPYFKSFLLKWPTVKDLAAAKDEDILEAWAGLGYYRRAHNLIKCARMVINVYDGLFPQEEKLLLQLPGIGSYTSAAIRSIGFNKKSTVVDGNISRIISRLFAINTPISTSQKTIKIRASNLVPSTRFSDYAQALMDLGSLICTPRKPNCVKCPIKEVCKSYIKGIETLIPHSAKKKVKPIKYGYVFVTINKNNNFILERRPEKGLLGGMLCFPSSEWKNSKDVEFNPPFSANWETLNEPVIHIFSHFTLSLTIALSSISFAPKGYLNRPLENFNRESLPSLMRKVFDIAKTHFQ